MGGREVDILWHDHPAKAWIPDPTDALELNLSPATSSLVARAEAAAMRASMYLPPNWAPTARLLIGAEGLASSSVGGIRAPLVDVALAVVDNRVASPTATRIADNVAVVEQAVDEGRAEPLSVDLVHRWHQRLLEHSRLPGDTDGAFRTGQVWIGGLSPSNAAYVPPPPGHVPDLMADLVEFANRTDLDPVTQAAVVHAQFETIHPYGNGNGRIGRVMVGWVLARRTLMRVPPPVSVRISRDMADYRYGLAKFRRDSSIEQWVRQFAEILERASGATVILNQDLQMQALAWRQQLQDVRSDSSAHALIEVLPEAPVLSAPWVAGRFGISRPAARAATTALADRGILRALAVDGSTRGRPSQWFVCEGVVAAVSRMVG